MIMITKRIVLFCFILIVPGCAGREKMYYSAPTELPHVHAAMKTPGFWIGRHPHPDDVVLTPKEIEKLNLHIQNELKLTKDISQFPAEIAGKELEASLEQALKEFQQNRLYLNNGCLARSGFYRAVRSQMNHVTIGGNVVVKFGFTIYPADQRLLPIWGPLYKIPGDVDFDEVQNSGLDVATPLAILHTSADGQWYYVESPLSSGWVETEKVVVCSRKAMKDYCSQTPFAVVIVCKADMYADPSLTKYYDYVPMGVRLPIGKKKEAESIEVLVPFKAAKGEFCLKSVFVRKRDIHKGYLPYTPRQTISEAFEQLNSPYGWGDIYGERDCSRFIQQIFATVGIRMPRNSGQQGQVGHLVGEFDMNVPEAEKLHYIYGEAVGGITLLQFKNQGHIALFLGFAGGRPYIIHATWGYHQRVGWWDTVRVINRVAVTDLFLGESGVKGSLAGRIVTINIATQ